MLFSKVKSTHTRRILCRVSGLVLLFFMSAYTRHFLTNSRSLFLFLFVALNGTVTFSLFTQVMEGKKCNIYPCVITSETTRTPSFTLESGVFLFLSIFFFRNKAIRVDQSKRRCLTVSQDTVIEVHVFHVQLEVNKLNC